MCPSTIIHTRPLHRLGQQLQRSLRSRHGPPPPFSLRSSKRRSLPCLWQVRRLYTPSNLWRSRPPQSRHLKAHNHSSKSLHCPPPPFTPRWPTLQQQPRQHQHHTTHSGQLGSRPHPSPLSPCHLHRCTGRASRPPGSLGLPSRPNMLTPAAAAPPSLPRRPRRPQPHRRLTSCTTPLVLHRHTLTPHHPGQSPPHHQQLPAL